MKKSLLLVLSFFLPSCSAVVQGEDSAVRQWSTRVSNPVGQPTAFEAPTIQAEIRPVVLHQRIPTSSVLGGGDFQVVAVQARLPVTDRLAILATKDGWIDLNPGGAPDKEGYADIAGGIKYALYEGNNLLVTPGLTYEFGSGQTKVFQGNGDGMFRPFVSAAYEPAPELNLIGSLGANLPTNRSAESQSIDLHLHADYEVNAWFSPMVELHGIHYSRSGRALPVNVEGGDLINLGATMVGGQNVVTGALGARFRFADNLSLGAIYGFPLTNRQDLFKDRVTVSLSWTF